MSFRVWLSYAERNLLENENVITVSSNVLVACAVADIKILPLAYEPKAEERYFTEPLHLAAIAQLPRVSCWPFLKALSGS